MKILLVMALTLLSFEIAQADEAFAKKCHNLKESIKHNAKTKVTDVTSQGTKAALIGVALSGYQVAKCPSISVEEVNDILTNLAN